MNLNTAMHRVTQMVEQLDPPEKVVHTTASNRKADALVYVAAILGLIAWGVLVYLGELQ